MAAASELLALAATQLGVKESPAGSNRVKYNTAYYGREVSGSPYPWCCAFIWWLFREAGASGLFYGGGKTASCTTLYHYYRKQGRTVPAEQARPGDLVFFVFDGNTQGVLNHIGLCERVEPGYITTIDGNTGAGNEANGGAVMRRRRALKYVGGVVRPDYEEESDMTKDEVQALVKEAVRAAQPKVYTDLAQAPLWAQGLVGRAMAAGIVRGDGTGKLNLTDQDLKTLSMLDGGGLIKEAK